MKFTFNHCNINVVDLERSINFYQQALGLKEISRNVTPNFTLVFLSDDANQFKLELTWLKDHNEAYNLGDNESHLAFLVDDYAAAQQLHRQMKCICFENTSMGLYFIEDPDGYWIEIIPAKR